METFASGSVPTRCPSCGGGLYITRLQCPSCGTELAGTFSLSALASLPEPYASLIELFLRVRGNMKDMERDLGLSYPTIRSRLEEALTAAGLGRPEDRAAEEAGRRERRLEILTRLEQGEISADEAAEALRQMKSRRSS